jgi:tetratricopeptide (TPR) repeat protein
MKTPAVALGAALVFSTVAVAGARAGQIPITTSSAEAKQLYLKGRDLQEKLRATDARPLFEQALAKDPAFTMAAVGLANSSGTAKEFFDGVSQAVALSAKASEPEKLVVCALDAGAKGEPARQKDCLTKLTAACPDDARAQNLMGAFHFGRQDYDAAIAAYQKATTLDPSFSQPYNQMGYAYRFLGKYDKAEQAFKKYIELIPGDPNPYDSYAELLMKTGRFEESIKSYEKALSIDPNFVASYIGIGNNRVFMGQPAEARKTYAKLLQIARNDGEKLGAHFWTAMSYVHEGNTDAAVAEVDKMAAIDKAGHDQVALAGTYAQAGNILLEAGRVEDAAARFKQRDATIAGADVAAQVKDAAKRQALFDEARLALGKNDLATAKTKAAAYATAVATPKIPFELRQNRELAGRIALAEKDYKTAAAAFREANQQDPRVLYLQALADQGKGDLLAAKQASGQAADWNALSPTYGYVRGKAKSMLKTADKD